ncbi:hypothetical protein XELAEV_18006697mg [Xenopus laevis]|uniref:Secreted protein n=1 Tax=Xenopus laevis TaxID=8355 RepID=A0A974DZA8_XENLA|nr:hypothetical protein XELAEV_18006697mg [Xenopus laevis]
MISFSFVRILTFHTHTLLTQGFANIPCKRDRNTNQKLSLEAKSSVPSGLPLRTPGATITLNMVVITCAIQ